jgi:hypothetical protein
MKSNYSRPLIAAAVFAALSFVSPIRAAAPSLQQVYNFSESPPYELSYELPSGVTTADLDASFTMLIAGSTSPLSVTPVAPSTFVQRIFLGTIDNPTPTQLASASETEITAADLETGFSTTAFSTSDSKSVSGVPVDLSGYDYITIYTDFDSTAPLDFGYGSITLYATPEPSTWALVLGGLGMLGFVLFRRNRSALL